MSHSFGACDVLTTQRHDEKGLANGDSCYRKGRHDENTKRMGFHGPEQMGKASQLQRRRRALTNEYGRRLRRCCRDTGWGEPQAAEAGWGPLHKVLHNLFESSLSQPVCRFHHPSTLRAPETILRSLIAEMQLPDNYFKNKLEHTPKYR